MDGDGSSTISLVYTKIVSLFYFYVVIPVKIDCGKETVFSSASGNS